MTTLLTWIMGVVGVGLMALSYALLCLRVERLTNHVNRLIESEDQPPRRVTLSIGEGVLRDAVRRELRDELRRQQQGRN